MLMRQECLDIRDVEDTNFTLASAKHKAIANMLGYAEGAIEAAINHNMKKKANQGTYMGLSIEICRAIKQDEKAYSRSLEAPKWVDISLSPLL